MPSGVRRCGTGSPNRHAPVETLGQPDFCESECPENMKGRTMPNRILFLVSAVLASLVLALALPVIPNAAHAADDCLPSPDKATPSGGHWRYHIERGTGRKCWYLAGETAKSNQTKADQAKSDDATADDVKPASDDADTAASAPPRPAMNIKPSLERAAASPPDRPRPAKSASQPVEQAPANNAHAEFIDPPRDGQSAPAPQAQPDPQAAAPQVVAPLVAPQNSVATRWPSPAGSVSNDSTAPLAAAASAAPTPAPQPVAGSQPVAATDQVAPAASTDQIAVQPAGAAAGPDYLLYALIAAVTGFVAVVAFAAVRFLADWWRDWLDEHRWRRSVPSFTASRGASMMAMGEVPMGLAPVNDAAPPRSRGHRTVVDEEPPRRLEDEIDEIEQLLALTRQAAGETQRAAWQGEAPRDAAE